MANNCSFCADYFLGILFYFVVFLYICGVIENPSNSKTMIDYLTVQRCFGLTPDAVAQTLGTETQAERVARLEAEVEELKKCCKE